MILNPRLPIAGVQLLAALLIYASVAAAETPAAPLESPPPAAVAPASQNSQPAPGELIAPSNQAAASNQAAPATATAPNSAAAPGDQPAPAAAKPAADTVPRVEAPMDPWIIYPDWVLTEDTVWRGEVLIEGALTLAPQATLTIMPGTVVRFRFQGTQVPLLVVQGRIVAVGTREAPILFTSNFAVPAAGDWQGIMLLGSEKKNQLEFCRIQGAQTGLEALFSSVTLKEVQVDHTENGMRFQDTLVSMEGGGASGCGVGLSFTQSEATLRNVNIERNLQGIQAKGSSLHLQEALIYGNNASLQADSSRIKFQGGSVHGNGKGIALTGCEGSVSGARLLKTGEFGLFLSASRIRVSGNQISGNGNNGLVVNDGAAAAWENSIYENAGYDLYNAGTEEFRAPGNWWGGVAPKVFDNGGRGAVRYAPVLDAQPSPSQLPVQR